MLGVVKIGYTDQACPNVRIGQLYTTGVPLVECKNKVPVLPIDGQPVARLLSPQNFSASCAALLRECRKSPLRCSLHPTSHDLDDRLWICERSGNEALVKVRVSVSIPSN